MDAVNKALSRDAILHAQDLRHERLSVPEWGGDVLLRGMSAQERDVLLSAIDPQRSADHSADTERNAVPDSQLKAYLCVHCIVDQQGRRLFEDSDTEALQRKNPAVLDRVASHILQLSGIGAQAVETLEKN